MTIARLFPIFRTTDLPRLRGFYEQAFGADVTYRYDQDGIDVYVALSVGGGSIGIGFEADIPRGDAIAVWLYSDDVDAAYSASLAAGAASVVPPEDMPWDERVAQVRDPDGNLLYLATGSEG